MSDAAPVIHVSAAVVTDEHGLALVVRKRGASVFQQPGGKPDPGEDAADAVLREMAEEIGVRARREDLEPLGRFTAVAANEPGHMVVADAFAVRIRHDDAVAAAEIAELRWIAEHEVDEVPLAMLSRTHLIGFAWR
ncbi:NUDIX hydrolase [Microbacterium sp. GXF7504]